METPARGELVAEAARIAQQVAGPAAADVDHDGRFPAEAVRALKEARLLGAGVPTDLSGGGCSLTELAAMCEVLGRHCAATAMIFAMHQIQIGCLVRHGGGSGYVRQFLRDLTARQLLIASVTSEVGVGGDMRSSRAAAEVDGDALTLCKEATTISYGAQADALLVTARRTPDSPPGDQVLVLLPKSNYVLEQTGHWDTFGMRGTCSPGFNLRASGRAEQIVPGTFADIAAQTMVPYSHILWASAWIGLAKGAVAKTRAYLRAEARRRPSVVPAGSVPLAEVLTTVQLLEHSVRTACADYERLTSVPEGAEVLTTVGYALQINNLKLSASQLVPDIVTRCLGICGIAGYKNDTPYSLGRHLRDAHSAALMVSNHRILATNASLLLVHKDN